MRVTGVVAAVRVRIQDVPYACTHP